MVLLEISELKKSFRTPDGDQHLVVNVSTLTVREKEQVALRGESGSGKTTLLNLIAGILQPDAGKISFAGRELSGLGEAQRDQFRAENIGYIFQTFNLLQGYSALENVLLGMKFGPGVNRETATALLKRVGLGEKMHHLPRQLSIGQQQRVAVARALANKPKLVLADEPTGNLDAKTSREVLQLIRETCAENNAALLLVSHDPSVLSHFDRVLNLSDLNRASAAIS